MMNILYLIIVLDAGVRALFTILESVKDAYVVF